MNVRRGDFDPPPAPSSTQAATPTVNRLRRSFRRTQTVETEPLRNQHLEFKTPTRVPRSRSGGGFSAESPQNDSEFQQDIIWDATSPSPNRLSKSRRGKKPSGIVNISEIVSRIAPKHGRPQVTEPTLQQWIGDTIPCTPDVQAPKPKKKSPRPNGVDDLLKLAKQFDFNMFRRDEEEEEEEEEEENQHQQSLELLSQDVLDFQNDLFPPLPGNHQPAASAEPEPQMDDDFDFLFDAPTQHVSGSITQVSQVKLPPSASANTSASSHTGAVSTTIGRAAPANDDFEDDWENDDLLNDSQVIEMTQNPPSEIKRHVDVPACVGFGPAAAGKESARQRSTFTLESHPHFPAQRSQTEAWRISKVDDGAKAAGASGGAGLQSSWKNPNPVKSEPQKLQFNPKTFAPSVRNVPETAQSATRKPAAAASDLLDEDLNLFFSSDAGWDDDDDDDLLREMCEDVENQINHKQVLPPASNQRAALQPANQKPFPQKQTHQTPPTAAGGSYSRGAQIKTFRFTKNTSASTNTSVCVRAAPSQNAVKEEFTFKTPNNPVLPGTNKVLGKCSAAEIELKKQQAMERRRQKLQASQNLRAPT